MLEWSPQLVFLAYAAIFVGALLAFDGIRQLLSRNEDRDEARNRRMRAIKKGVSDEEIRELFLETSHGGDGPRNPVAWTRKLLRQAGFSLGARTFLALAGAFAVIVFFIASQYLDPRLAAVAAVVVGVGVPFLIVASRGAERRKQLTAQMPDALDLMARGLRVGHPVAVTVESVATNMPDPIGTEFGLIHDQIAYGDDLPTAFHDFAERVGTEDARYLAVSIGIQHGTGGNLARVLDTLSRVIRDRFQMKKRILAISAEGRISALILTAIPVWIYMSLTLTAPDFYGAVEGDPLLKPLLGTVVVLVVLQGLILRKLVTFKF